MGTLTFYDTDWEELSSLVAAITGVQEYVRSQVQHAFFGLGGGKVSTLKEIVRVGTFPTAEPRIKVVSNVSPDEWVINVYVVDEDYVSGADPTVGLQSAAPAGFEVQFSIVDEATFTSL